VAQPWWKPSWSVPAAQRAIRATVLIPALFALGDKVVKDPQFALFATFGGFATLVIANFGGTRLDKLAAHIGLALTGGVLLIIGTLVSGTTWLAVIVTVPVTFAVFFAGVAGPNAASGAVAVMFAYVLPVASAGNAGMIPSRLEGWLLASAVGTAAVVLMAPRAPGNRIRAAAAALAAELANRLQAAANGIPTTPEAVRGAKEGLRAAFSAGPYRPTGLAGPDQALAALVQLLDWGAAQVGDAFDGHIDMTKTCDADNELLRTAATLFTTSSQLLSGPLAANTGPADTGPANTGPADTGAGADFAMLEAARAKSAARLRDLAPSTDVDARVAAAQAVHAQAIGVVARSSLAEALVASRRATPEQREDERRQWYTQQRTTSAQNGSGLLSTLSSTPRVAGVGRAIFVVRQHASIRSVWFLNSLRAGVALAAAVAVADLSGVQHAFWVVLGTLSVLRTNAAATGATAWRGLAGTTVGFAVGAVLLVGIGTGQAALWTALPLAVLVAAYAPGTTPFLVGQAAFTVTIVVLFNILAPAGWKVGLLRVEDIAIGCGVSLVVGVLFWPRGASSLVGDDLGDSFRRGADYLIQAVDWALSELMTPPAAGAAAASAAIRLDDSVRGFLTEQGSKRLPKEDLWTLVNASTRLRLTALTLAELRPQDPVPSAEPGAPAAPTAACLPLTGSDEYAGAPACVSLKSTALGLAGFYELIADEVAHSGRNGSPQLIPAPPQLGPAVPRTGTGTGGSTGGSTAGDHAAAGNSISPEHELPHPHLLWVQEHLHHLSASAQMVSEPALHLADIRSRPWWR
jgi:uncharacterized membrane protein YccC